MVRRIAAERSELGFIVSTFACTFILCACSSASDAVQGSAGKSGGGATSAGSGGRAGIAGGSASGGGDADASAFGRFSYEWSLIDAPTGNGLDCGRAGIDLFVFQLGTGSSARDYLEDCAKGHDSITALPGTYDVNVELKNQAGLVFGGASRGLTAVAAGEVVTLAPFQLGLHTVRFPWTVSKAGQPSSCEAVGASEVQVHWIGGFSGYQISHSCSQLTSDYVILGAGAYALDGTLLSATGSKLATWRMVITLPDLGDSNVPTIAFDVP